MKTLLLTTLLFLLPLEFIANELKWVDKQIEAIKPPRSGISKTKINSIKSPFIFLSKNKEKKEKKSKSSSMQKSTRVAISSPTTKNTVVKQSKRLQLDAIINKSALINDKWYKLDDKIGKYTLSSISGTSVILSYKKQELLLSTNTKNTNLKFKNN